MAMAVAVAGFSAQGAPFKPSRHPLFLLSSSPFRLSTSASSSMGASIGQKNSSLQGRNSSSPKSGVILTCPFFVKVSSHEKRKALHFLRMTLGSAILNANRNYGVFFLGCSLGIDQPKEWGGSSPSGINCWNAATKEVIAFKQSIQAATLHQQSVENSTIESTTKNDTLCNDIQDKWEFEAFNMSNLRSQHYHELHGNVLSSQMLPRINYQCMLQFGVGNVGTDGLVNGGLLEETKFSFPEVADEADDFPGQLVMGNKDIPPKKVNDENEDSARKSVHKVLTSTTGLKSTTLDLKERLLQVYDKVLVVDNISLAKEVVNKLTTQYEDLVHACDTEVAKIDVKDETPVDHGEIICFSVYSGPQADYFGKSCIWVDVLDGGRDVLMEFAPFFGSASIKKVWHNYSFDYHIIENYGIKVSGFYADTMHLARLWDSSRRILGGYSLEALTGDPKVMDGGCMQSSGDLLSGKISMKSIFGRKKIKKDGSEGKLTCVAPVEELQREERIPWICYSALDSISTLSLFESLKAKLSSMKWVVNGQTKGVMYQFYEEYLRPFGKLLVEMESVGMLVDRAYLADMEKLAISEQNVAASRFRKWAAKYCPDAAHMNVGSDAQLRQLFFGGIANCKNPDDCLPLERGFKVPNVDKVVEEGKKVPLKHRTIKLRTLWEVMPTDMFTASGWPSVSGDALKIMAGKVSAEEFGMGEDLSNNLDDVSPELSVDDFEKSDDPGSECGTIDKSSYGTAYEAFGGGKEGKEACHAIAALCEVCSIDSLISNFILPLQGSHISGNGGRIHCSLNINTETGRLSARRPNLQNQPALEKDRYRIRQAFIAAPGKSLIVADYGQLELRILAHLAGCKSMLDAFKAGGDFHSQTAMNMYPYILDAVKDKRVLLEWDAQLGEEKPPVPLLKDAFASERRKAKMLNFSIAYGKTPVGLSRDWKVSVQEARRTVDLWYKDRQEVLKWQEERKKQALTEHCVYTLLGRSRRFPSTANASKAQKGHIERAAINTPVQGSAADVAMCAMLEISRNTRLKELGWKLLLQVHDEVILEGPTESAEVAKAIVVECMSKPFYGQNFLKVGLAVDAKCAQNWYAAK